MRRIPRLSGDTMLGHVREMRTDPIALLNRLNRECGDIGAVRFLNTWLVVANTPEMVGEVLVDKARSFRKSRFLRAALHPLIGDGLFNSDGDLWRRQRKLMAPIFQPARVAEFAPCMSQYATDGAEQWRDGETVDVARETTRVTMAVAGKTLFDADTLDESDELGDALTVALHWVMDAASSTSLGLQLISAGLLENLILRAPPPAKGPLARVVANLEVPVMWPGAGTRRLKAAIRVLDGRVQRMIDERRADSRPRRDLLTRLLGARDEETKGPMSDRQLRDEIVTLFVAGHETTATALAWAFYLIDRHPDVRAALEREVSAIGTRPLTASDVPRLPLAQKVFKESLRMYPPVRVLERQAVEPVEIGGHQIPRGAFVAVWPWALHHRPELWPDPERFDPERFTPQAEDARPRYAYVPFGAGARVCIGNHFALLEGPIVIAAWVARARLESADDREVLSDPAAATMRPLGGVTMRVMRR